jgi:hypothetical protein
MRKIPALIVLAALHSSAMADTFRFIKPQSGPSERIAENRFVFDEVRNRFVHPQGVVRLYVLKSRDRKGAVRACRARSGT